MTNTCRECNGTFKSRSRLREHAIIHTGLKPFECDQCSKAYNSQSNLRKHKTVHAHKEFACVQCRKIFSAAFKLKQHLKLHNSGNIVKCNVCAYKTNQKTNLETHMKRHVKALIHPCLYCDKKFSIRSDRDKHEYIHKNINNMFQCIVCFALFKQKNGLLNHKKVHQEPTERCQQCDRTFSSKSNLKSHQITHSDYARFECNKCHKFSKRASDLKKHKELSCLSSLVASINNLCKKVVRDTSKKTKKYATYRIFSSKRKNVENAL